MGLNTAAEIVQNITDTTPSTTTTTGALTVTGGVGIGGALNTALGATFATTSGGVAIGGATIGTNALAVTGTANISGVVTVGGALRLNTTSIDFAYDSVPGAYTMGYNGPNIASAGTYSWNGGGRITSPGVGNIQLGEVDQANAPVAQTTRVQSASGVADTAGANWTLQGSAGTGTGAGGSLIFQVAPASTTASTKNAYATALTIDSTKLATFAGAIVGSNIHPAADSTTAFQLTKADGTSNVLNVDTTNTRVGINRTNPAGALDVNGSIFQSLSSGSLSAYTYSQYDSTKDVQINPQTHNVVIGVVASATPTARLLQIGEASRSGTDSNVAGANGTITSGNGTGNATGSSLIFQTPVAVASGTGAQTMTTGLTIHNGAIIPGVYAIGSLPAGTTGMIAVVNDQLTAPAAKGIAPTAGGSVVCVVIYNGSAWVGI